MKKLLFICVLMAALCACEAPDGEAEKEKELIVLDGGITPTEVPKQSGNDDTSADDKADKDDDASATPTKVPSAPDKNDKPDTDTAGPTPTTADGDDDMNLNDKPDNAITADTFPGGSYAKGRELFCTAASEKEGRDIAAVYGITFVDYAYGVATFTTNEDPAAVVQRGKDNGWKILDVNRISTIQ